MESNRGVAAPTRLYELLLSLFPKAAENTKFNSAVGQLGSTKQSTTLALSVIALLVIASTAVGVYYYGMAPSAASSTKTGSGSNTTTQSAGSSSAGAFKVNYDRVVVGYNSGLWEIGLQDVSGKAVKQLTVVLKTPTESRMCTGIYGSLSFANCPANAGPSGSFPANNNFTGYATGVGAGSATVGKSYNVIIMAVFVDGSSANDTISVVATASAPGA